MNLIKTSKNKNDFILKKSQRTVKVVLTLFYILSIPTWQEIETKTNKNINKKTGHLNTKLHRFLMAFERGHRNNS